MKKFIFILTTWTINTLGSKNKFKDDVFIYINEINFDDIDKDHVNLVIFDDLVFSNKKISEFYCRSRKLNTSCVFIGHRYFGNIDRTLKTILIIYIYSVG